MINGWKVVRAQLSVPRGGRKPRTGRVQYLPSCWSLRFSAFSQCFQEGTEQMSPCTNAQSLSE